jgi:hypothetical protein
VKELAWIRRSRGIEQKKGWDPMLKKVCLFANVALCLSAVCLSVSFAGKPPTNDGLPAVATIVDTGTNINSDGGGPYIDATDGRRCVLFSQSYDFVLRTGYPNKAKSRKMLFNFPANDLNCPTLPNTSIPPTSTDGWFLNVNDVLITGVLNTPAATGAWRQAVFYTSVGDLGFGGHSCAGWVWVEPTARIGNNPVAWNIRSSQDGFSPSFGVLSSDGSDLARYPMIFEIDVQLQ